MTGRHAPQEQANTWGKTAHRIWGSLLCSYVSRISASQVLLEMRALDTLKQLLFNIFIIVIIIINTLYITFIVFI